MSAEAGAGDVPEAAAGDAAEARLRGQVGELGHRFLARTASQVAQLHDLLPQLQADAVAALAAMQRLAHAIHGGGAVFGFHALSDRAAEFEHLCVQAAPAPAPGTAPDALAQELARCLRTLEAAFAQARAASGGQG